MRLALTASLLAFILSPGVGAAQAGGDITAQYVCPGPLSFNAIFSADGKSMLLEFTGHDRFRLDQTISGSGFRYAGQGYELHGKGDMALLFQPGSKDPIECKAQDQPASAGRK